MVKTYSSTEKGDKFENRVYKIFSNELNSNRLYLNPKFCKIKKNEKYFSNDRGKYIIVDISIEAYLPNQQEWSQLLVIECKDYNKSFPVDDVEEFHSKLNQIAGSGIKGIIASTNGFQSGALNFAKSKNIGLIKFNSIRDFKWILKRVAPCKINIENIEYKNREIYYAITNEFQIENNIELYATIGNVFTTSLYDFIKNMFIDTHYDRMFLNVTNHNDNCVVPFIPREDIEKCATEIYKSIRFDQSEFSIELNCKSLKKIYGIDYKISKKIELDNLGFVILGKIQFDPDILTLSSAAQSSKFRLKFTLAHELGHYFLGHKEYLLKEIYTEQDFNNNTGEYISIKDISRMEWQANQFASFFLLPSDEFIKEFNTLINQEDIKNKGHGVLFIDNQKCNVDLFFKITNSLRNQFRVSRKVIEFRLKELKLLNDSRKQINNVSEKIYDL